MLRHYLKTGGRVVLRHKSYAAINTIGLAAGFLTCLLIAVWVRGELSFDQFHENAESIWRVTNEVTLGNTFRESASSMAPLVPAALERYPEIVAGTRLRPAGSVWLSHEGREVKVPQLTYADTLFFDVFSFPLLSGSPEEVLLTANSAVLSRETARKLFDDSNPIGEIIRINNGVRCTVTGVVEDCPVNSHLRFDVLVSFETLVAENPDVMSEWGRFGNYSYLRMQRGTDPAALEVKLTELVLDHIGPTLEARNIGLKLRTQRLTDIHLHSDLESELSENGSITAVLVFSAIAILVLIMACLNFINLAIARSTERTVEVHVRKVLGATRRDLIYQSLVEVLLIAGGALVLALALLSVFASAYEDVFGSTAAIASVSDLWYLMAVVLGLLLFGLLAGLGPALQLSMFSPVRGQKSDTLSGRWGTHFRRLIVVLQFSAVTVLVIASLGVRAQIDFLEQKDIGIRREHMLLLPSLLGAGDQSAVSVRDEIRRIPGVRNVSLTTAIPLDGPFPMTSFALAGPNGTDNQLLVTIAGDAEFVRTLGLEITIGRDFSDDLITDSTEAILINETAAAAFGLSDPVGRSLSYTVRTSEGSADVERRIVGVVKDFHFKSLHGQIEPLVITREPTIRLHPFDQMVISLESGASGNIINEVKKVWRQFAVDKPFDYVFLDELLAGRYSRERRVHSLVMGFGVLAVVVGCLGLLGMMSYSTARRMKEIAIRKTVGAGFTSIVTLLIKETIALDIVSIIIACPIAYRLMEGWLSTFAYRSEVGAGTYLLAFALSLTVAVLTTGFHSVQAALRSPILSLRHE